MAIVTKGLLSGSTNGKAIKVVATASTGTTIHTAVSGTSALDEVWLYANNTSTSDVILTIEYGGTTSPDNVIVILVKAYQGPTIVIPGFLLQNGLVITAYASVANVITINGYVNNFQ